MLWFSSFIFFLTLISFVVMDFQKFSSFFQLVGLVPLEVINSCKIHRKMWFYVANHKKCQSLLWSFPKSISRRKISSNFIQLIQVLFYPIFQVYFGQKLWLILYFSTFWSYYKPNLVKNCDFIKKIDYFKSKTTLYQKMKHVL